MTLKLFINDIGDRIPIYTIVDVDANFLKYLGIDLSRENIAEITEEKQFNDIVSKCETICQNLLAEHEKIFDGVGDDIDDVELKSLYEESEKKVGEKFFEITGSISSNETWRSIDSVLDDCSSTSLWCFINSGVVDSTFWENNKIVISAED